MYIKLRSIKLIFVTLKLKVILLTISWLLQGVLFSIGSAFLYYVNHFKLYSSFCASHSKAQKVLHPSKFPLEISSSLFHDLRFLVHVDTPDFFAIDNLLVGNNCPTSFVTLYKCIVPGKFSDLLFVSIFREWVDIFASIKGYTIKYSKRLFDYFLWHQLFREILFYVS